MRGKDLQDEAERERASIWGTEKIRGYYSRGMETNVRANPNKKRRRSKTGDSDSEDIYADPTAKDEDAPITKLSKKKKAKKEKTPQQAKTEQLTLHVSVPIGLTRVEVMEVFASFGMKKCELKDSQGKGVRFALVQLKTEKDVTNAMQLDGTCPSSYKGHSISVSRFRGRRQGKRDKYKERLQARKEWERSKDDKS